MKKYLLIFTIIFCFNNIYSQVLYNETFDNFTVGNLGADCTGKIQGQGGWFSICLNNPTINFPTIISEPNRGNVLKLGKHLGITNQVSNIVKKIGLNTLIDQRTQGNDVIKLELDYYTGEQDKLASNGHAITLGYDVINNYTLPTKLLVRYVFFSNDGELSASSNGGSVNLDKNAPNAILPSNIWVTLIVYLDYNNRKAYFETPYFNTIAVTDFLKTSTSTNLIEDFKPNVLALQFADLSQTNAVNILNKYDNIKITALKNVPPYVLSTESFLATKFNMYPNPANNVINISNTENMLINHIIIYDITGKELSIQRFNNESKIQLNVENLKTGTYMIHLETNAGVVVKKLIKK